MQAGESGLMLQAPRGLAGEPDVAAWTAKPQKDGSRGSHLSFQGGRFGDKALTTDKSLMACLGGTLVKKALMMLVAKAFLTSRFLEVVVESLLATAPGELDTSDVVIIPASFPAVHRCRLTRRECGEAAKPTPSGGRLCRVKYGHCDTCASSIAPGIKCVILCD
jgi:hypothetical protein